MRKLIFALLALCGFTICEAQTGGGFPPPPLNTFCNSNCGTLTRVGTLIIEKNSTTSRNTTTVPAADPDLQSGTIPAGGYHVECMLMIDGTTTGTQGFQFFLQLGGGGGGASAIMQVFGRVNGALVSNEGLIGSVQPSFATISVHAAPIPDFLYIVGTAKITSGGTFNISWAQASSSANNTNLYLGSYCKITRIT